MDPVEKIFKQANNVDDILAHFGVKGMRWGVRKRTSQNQHRNGPKSEQAAKVDNIINNIKKNGIGAATNDDLKMLEQRIKLEVKYKEMFPRRKTLTNHGLDFAKKVLIPVAERGAKSFLESKADKILKGKAQVETIELGKHSSGYGRHLKR